MAKQSSITGNVVKIGGQDVFADPKKGYVPVKQTQTVSNADNISYDPRTGKWGGVGSTGSKTTTTATIDAQGNKVMEDVVDTQNYSVGGSSQKTVSSPGIASSIQSPLVRSIAPTDTKRIADGTDNGYMTEEEKKKRGIVDITAQVQPGFDGSTQKFQQGQLTEDQLRARYEADLASGASEEQMRREYGDLGAPDGMGAVGSAERMARQKQQAADKAIQNELQDLNRAGQIFDRGNEDLTMGKERSLEQNAIDVERAKEDRTFQLEELRKNVNRNIEDTGKQRDETMQAIRRQGAALGLNVVSTFQQSYKNTQDKFNNVINRMQEDLNTQEGRSTLEDQRLDADYSRATKQLLQDYEKESTRLKQDFEYTTRDYRENLILDANKLVEQYGLSSDKLGGRLQELALDAFNKVETAYGSYLDNSQKQVDLLDSQVNNVLDTRNKYLAQQKTYADNFLAGSQNLTIQDLNAMVRDGQISEQMAQQTLGQVVQMALDTIDTATVDGVGVQFQDQIIEAINAGLTPMQAIQQVMASEEFAPVVEKMQEMGLNPYEAAIARQEIQQGNIDLQQGNLEYQTALQDYVAGGGQISRDQAIQVYGSTPAVRNFNPGNIMDTGFGGQKVPGERFTRFASPQEGFQALVAKIQNIQAGNSKVYSPNMTLTQYMSKYAPSSDNNNPQAYAQQVANHIGIDINTKIGNIDPVKLAEAHAKHEDGASYRMLKDLGVIGGQQGGGSGLVDPVTGADFDFATRITNMIPATLRNSEVEQKNLADRIKTLYETGMTPRDAALRYMGFNVTDEKDKSFAEKLVMTARQLPDDIDPTFLTTIADLVNTKNYEGATRKLENIVLDQAKKTEGENFISEPKVKTAVTRASEIDSFISSLDNSPIGIVEGKMSKRLGKLKGSNAQQISTDVTQLVSKMRNELIGASATAGEIEMLEPLLPSLDDSPANFMIKLNKLRTDPVMQYNNIRTTYGLPAITEKQLISNAKSSLYRDGSSIQKASTAPVAQERGDFEKRTSLQSSPLFQLTK